jgi:hypothetical protein
VMRLTNGSAARSGTRFRRLHRQIINIHLMVRPLPTRHGTTRIRIPANGSKTQVPERIFNGPRDASPPL